MEQQQNTGLTFLGKLVSFLLILGLIGLGAYVIVKKGIKTPGSSSSNETAHTADASGPSHATVDTGATDSQARGHDAEPTAMMTEVPTLSPPGVYTPKDNVVEIELSEYPGYAGLIVANGGLEPTENSVFFRKGGFKVKLTLSEEESWSSLNAGKMAASATTADVLAVYGRQFQVTVPALIGFSRGADGVVVRKDIKRINNLKGKILATSQFTEAEFFIRYLAQEAGLEINALPTFGSPPDPDKLNLCFCADAFEAGDLFIEELKTGGNRLSGAVTWSPKTTEIVEESDGKATILTTNKNLLIVADILIVNRGFAQANPDKVTALVHGLLEGNRLVRENPDAYVDVIAKAFKWDRNEVKDELAKVHFANLPENQAFFSGAIDAAGSFSGIYQSAVYAYGNQFIPNPAPPERFVDLSHLKTIEQTGEYKNQTVAIAPIRTGGSGPIEDNPLLSKDIRFTFKPNSSELEMNDPQNTEKLTSIRELLQVSPGSTILLRGHVDDALVSQFRQQGGESFVRNMALKAVQLSKDRAEEVKRELLTLHPQLDASRLEVIGRGWEEPIGTDPDPEKRSEQNRRVEVQWFTLE